MFAELSYNKYSYLKQTTHHIMSYKTNKQQKKNCSNRKICTTKINLLPCAEKFSKNIVWVSLIKESGKRGHGQTQQTYMQFPLYTKSSLV